MMSDEAVRDLSPQGDKCFGCAKRIQKAFLKLRQCPGLSISMSFSFSDHCCIRKGKINAGNSSIRCSGVEFDIRFSFVAAKCDRDACASDLKRVGVEILTAVLNWKRDEDCYTDLSLVVGELITDAFKHSDDVDLPIVLEISNSSETLMMSISNPYFGRKNVFDIAPADLYAESGRGIAICDKLLKGLDFRKRVIFDGSDSDEVVVWLVCDKKPLS